MASMNENHNGDGFAALLTPSVPNMHDNDIMPHDSDSTFNGSVQEHMAASLNQYDVSTLKSENKILRSKLKQLQSDLQSEQDAVSSGRKKLNVCERERLDAVAKANEEASRLDTEVTKLRAHLEKAEAVRQDLEFQLTKAKRDILHEKRNVSERETLLNEVNDSMKLKVNELTGQIESMCDELENTRLKGNEESRKLKRDLEEKEGEMGKLRADVDAVENEKAKLENALTQSDNTLRELEERLHETDDEKRSQGDELRRQLTELDMLREQHDMLKKDYENASTRVKSLEDGIEAERAAHLESKFNSEIVQLRLRDLENALDLEKSTKIEALTSTDKLNKQLRELQHIYDEERKLSLETKEKLEKAEKEYASLSKQLSKELDEKRKVIKDLSHQLEGHQKDFNELKQELIKAKKKQSNLEETYSGCMKEVELLNESFKFDGNGKKTVPKKKVVEKKLLGKNPQPTIVMENLRKTLIAYRRKLDEMTTNYEKEKNEKEKFEKECKRHKDVICTKEKALQSTQTGMNETTKELHQTTTEKRDMEKLIKQLREDLDVVHMQLQKEKTQNRELAEQCSAVISRSKSDEKMCSDLPSSEKVDILKRPFEDASILLTEYASKLVNNCRWMNEKIRHLEVTIKNKEELVEHMQKAHEEQLEKLASIAEGRSQQWVQQKAEMEQHYSQLLGEIHNRHKKTQTMADQAWEKVRMTGSLQQGLEKECDDLRKQMLQMRDEHECLLAACALLCGALYPLYQRNLALSLQRGILQEQLDRFDMFKSEVQKLVDALSLDNLVSQQKRGVEIVPSKSRVRTPLLRFRAGAIAVIAANRLVNVNSRGNCKMFVTQDLMPGLGSSMVCTGGIEQLQHYPKFSGVADVAHFNNQQDVISQFQAVDWLCSTNLLTTITATMGDLVTAVDKAKKGEKGFDQKKVVKTAQNAYQKLVCHLSTTFPTVLADPHPGFRERTSFVKILGFGLNRALVESSMDGSIPVGIESSHNTLSSLQKHMLEFTQRLHTAEVERRDLRIQVNKLQQEGQKYTDSSIESERMAKELKFLRQQVQNTVERDRFEQICAELNRALQREQEAQQLLNEQSQQLHSLSLKLDVQASSESQKEHTLTEAVQGLSEAKMETKRQEQRVRQLNRQVQQIEIEKVNFAENVKDAENALRTAAKDKEALSAYMKTIEKILEQVIGQLSYSGTTANIASVELSRLLAPELVPSSLSKISPELAESQSLVACFVDALKQPYGKIGALHEELEQYKKHISTLKQELSAACRREYENEEYDHLKPKGVEEPYSPSRTLMGNEKFFNGNRNFAPLEEDMNDTYGTPLLPPPHKSRLPTGHVHSQRSLNYPTDSHYSASLKRRPTEGGERR